MHIPAPCATPDSPYERFCRQEFADINTKLDAIDAFLRGNGRNPLNPGFAVRVDRLERFQKVFSRVVWGIVGALVPLCVGGAWAMIREFIRRG